MGGGMNGEGGFSLKCKGHTPSPTLQGKLLLAAADKTTKGEGPRQSRGARAGQARAKPTDSDTASW